MEFFIENIEKVKKENRYRQLKNIDKIEGKYIYINGEKIVDFSSNNYLGLRDDKRIIEAAHFALDKYGLGSGASRIVSGDCELFYQFEQSIARFKQKEAALLFNSGYDANLGVISSIMDKNDVIFSDKYNHASIYDGILLSGAKLIRYRHNDINDLENKLKKYRCDYKKAMVITDSIFSMDGDRADLKSISDLKNSYDFIFMVDEAHATGIFGNNGEGLVNEQKADVDIIMGTLGKAFGTQGAYIASKKIIIEYVINNARSFIFTTALSPILIAASLQSLEIIKKESFRREKIILNSEYLRRELKNKNYNLLNSSTQIIPVIVNNDKEAIELSRKLYNYGIYIPAIRYPAVPLNQPRLRISVNYNIDINDIEKIFECI